MDISLSEAERSALEKLKALVGNEQVGIILEQGPEVLCARLVAFMQLEFILIGQVHDHLASVMTTQFVPMPEYDEPRAQNLSLSVNTYEGKERYKRVRLFIMRGTRQGVASRIREKRKNKYLPKKKRKNKLLPKF